MDTVLLVSGASRGNPGPAGCGFILCDDAGNVLANGGWYLGDATNNIAEYTALIWGLRNASAAHTTAVEVYTDSQLLVAQLRGSLKVRTSDLKPLYHRAEKMIAGLKGFSIDLVRRADNKDAEKLVTDALYAREPVGDYLVGMDGQQVSLFRVRQNDDEAPTDAEEVEGSVGDYLHKGGAYELTVKSRLEIVHDGVSQKWSVEAMVEGFELDGAGRIISLEDLKYDLSCAVQLFDGREIAHIAPFNRIEPTMEHLARVLYWELDKMLPDTVRLVQVGIWSSEVGAKMLYRAR